MKINRRAAGAAFACAALVAFATGASAQAPLPPKIAVLSLIGDEISVDDYVGETKTNLQGVKHQAFPMSAPVFDNTALLAVQDALKRLYPAAQVATLAPAKAGSDMDPARLVVDGKVEAANPLIAALRKEGYAQLVVVAKLRAPAIMKLRETSVGHGHISGLGFYIDHSYEIQKISTGEIARGFLTPYAYLKLSLVDLQSLAVVRDKEILQERMQADVVGKAGLNLWDSLSAEEKTKTLRELVTHSVGRATPVLFESVKP